MKFLWESNFVLFSSKQFDCINTDMDVSHFQLQHLDTSRDIYHTQLENLNGKLVHEEGKSTC